MYGRENLYEVSEPTECPAYFKAEADAVMQKREFDLLICMPGTDNNDVFDIARTIKLQHESIPIVVLTPFSHGITQRMQDTDVSIFEYVFCWLGNTDLLVTIIKLIEDKMNVEHDVKAGVQMILLVEDRVRFYSSILPNLYKFVLQQSLEFATEALNASLETLRMRGRPKILLARNYEEAWAIYSKYADNALGVISDCRYPMKPFLSATAPEDEKVADAGFQLLDAIRKNDPYIPLIMESAEGDNRRKAEEKGYIFIDKTSKKMDVDLRDMVRKYFGFGSFVFRDPETHQEVCRIRNLKELQNNIFSIPQESLLYHLSRNNVSRWLGSRALFPLSEFLKRITWDSLQDVDAHRQIIFDAIVAYRRMKNQGVVAVFQRERFDQYSNFARIGDGSLGGKGRGLAFLDRLLTRHEDLNGIWTREDGSQYPDGSVKTMIPKTVVLCTDIFDEFMDANELYPLALSEIPDSDILNAFLHAHLPERLLSDLDAFMEVVKGPIAVRSSSLLEDSHYQPFAGVYSTYMIPYLEDRAEMLRMLADAIKGFRVLKYRGANVTIPYKKTVFPYMDSVSDAAQAVGSINTIVKKPDGAMFGDNTDVYGFREMLRHSGIRVSGAKVLVLGSGGASAAVTYVLRSEGAIPVIISRSGENNYDNLALHADAEVIVNTTPLGMYPNNGESPVDLRTFPACSGVLDVVYNPARTAILLQAEELGIPCACGLYMLVAQAKKSSEDFTGATIPDSEISRIEGILSRTMQNIVIVGMPGCGKTTVSALLAQKLSRRVVDTDAEIVSRAGMSIPEIFEKFGEEHFRKLETEVMRNFGKQGGLIISTGGGCVTREENYPLLHQNGTIVWIRRDTSLLSRDGRPISLSSDLDELYEKRKPCYERFSDIIADNNGTVEETVSSIMEELQ